MIEKAQFCKYCKKDLNAKSAKKVFCNDKCRIYYSRELKRGTLDFPQVGESIGSEVVVARKQHNHSLTLTIKPDIKKSIPTENDMPVKMEGESGIDFSIRKREWMEKNK